MQGRLGPHRSTIVPGVTLASRARASHIPARRAAPTTVSSERVREGPRLPGETASPRRARYCVPLRRPLRAEEEARNSVPYEGRRAFSYTLSDAPAVQEHVRQLTGDVARGP